MYIRGIEGKQPFNDDVLKASTFGLKVGQSVKVEKVVESGRKKIVKHRKATVVGFSDYFVILDFGKYRECFLKTEIEMRVKK